MVQQKQPKPTLGRVLVGTGVGLTALAAGAGLFGLAWFSATSDNDLKEHGVRGVAEIVDLWTEDHGGVQAPGGLIDNREYSSCHFAIRFTPDNSNEPIEAELLVQDEEFAPWNVVEQRYTERKPGELIEVVYLPDSPERVESVHSVENAPGVVVGTVLLVLFGIFVVGLGVLGAYLLIFVGTAPTEDAT